MGGRHEDVRGPHPWPPHLPFPPSPGWRALVEALGESLARLLPPEEAADRHRQVEPGLAVWTGSGRHAE
jgi:hypothetical protein